MEFGTQLAHISSVICLAIGSYEVHPMVGVAVTFQNGRHYYIFILILIKTKQIFLVLL